MIRSYEQTILDVGFSPLGILVKPLICLFYPLRRLGEGWGRQSKNHAYSIGFVDYKFKCLGF